MRPAFDNAGARGDPRERAADRKRADVRPVVLALGLAALAMSGAAEAAETPKAQAPNAAPASKTAPAAGAAAPAPETPPASERSPPSEPHPLRLDQMICARA